MKPVKPSFTARIARPSDYRLAAQLCRRAVGPSDYVLSILRAAIDNHGLFLAWNEGQVVGMTNFERCIDGSGWLNMARTDPAWRRRGVALFLQRRIASHATQVGIRKLRLWVLSQNKPSIRACIKGGFRPVCEAIHISSPIRPKRLKTRMRPINAKLGPSPSSIIESPYLYKMNGYIPYKYHFLKASNSLVKQLLRREGVYKAAASSFILSKPERRFRTTTSSLTILNGPLGPSLRNARRVAREMGARHLSAYIPFNSYMLATAREFGFRRDDWGTHCIVFEKSLRAGT
jgi:GNAT superfamily N-acetyltransferase